ncbi:MULTISPECIES: SPOR domain-containing protein [Acetobacter]|uniref:SPOR domain-containing protein n=1 Tax=Acetobacter TaxID=434 RepID=UPI00031CFA3C|nr:MULTISPECIES: SPOR domain-containing protein [Acetobacter]ATI12749.1 SPOR domain-containing protein [Acetobacter pomorum]AXC27120.1 SPOR domain-containing protein [Acetobacter sp. JWB]KAA8426813.1 SPOR domain-containing protein [Acetobacter pomorum]KAA8438053.1 SPOR domain-containing protein [Acetobacter pomorum]KAA8450963.1 SPOR domain-containing protein [Acetobacter pomorum]
MSDEDRPKFSADDRISRARERMSMDYEDPAPTRPTAVGGRPTENVLTRFLSSDTGTRRLVYGAAGLGGLLVLGIGGWALIGHHQHGIAIMGPPPVSMRTKPVDPGGMQLDSVAMPDEEGDPKAHPVPAPEKPNPEALAAQYGAQGESDSAKPEGVPVPATGAEGAGAGHAADQQAAAAPPADAPSASAQEETEASTSGEEGDTAAAQSVANNPKPKPDAAVPAKDKDTAAASKAAPADTKTSTVPHGGVEGGKYQVQLAAVQNEDEARKEWSRLKSRYPTLFGESTPSFVRTEQNNATFYRLRVKGFASVATAREFCSAVRERGMACMVVRQ